MSIPQKSLFSLLSLCQKFLQSVEIWQSFDKKISLHSFFETRCTTVLVSKSDHISGFLPICQNQIQGLLKDFQGPYEGYIRRTKLHRTGNFISIYKRRKLTQRGPGRSPGRKWTLCTFEVRKKPSETTFSVSTGLVTAF